MSKLDEKILTGLVLMLSHQLDEKARRKGTQRAGGDYTREAVEKIRERKAPILGMLGIRTI